jgi:hypothetical protein
MNDKNQDFDVFKELDAVEKRLNEMVKESVSYVPERTKKVIPIKTKGKDKDRESDTGEEL